MKSLALAFGLALVVLVAGVTSQRHGNNNNNQDEPKSGGRFLSLPNRTLCETRPKHWTFNNRNYFFSADFPGAPPKMDWLAARNLCRERCMDAVSMESEAENDMVFNFIARRNITYIWTSGRLCDFTGCFEREDLKPLNILGWFWSNTNTKMAPTNKTPPGWKYQPWSQTGHTKKPQPDNAEFDINGTTEACMGVLNNLYSDNIKWHDIGCYHKKPVICEDNDELLGFVFRNNNRSQ